MKAVGTYIVVEKTKSVTRTDKSGLEIPSDIEDRFVHATIISVSEHGKKEFGLNDGDKILYDKNSYATFKSVNGKEYIVITCRNVAVVL